jgi:hypothetical protein
MTRAPHRSLAVSAIAVLVATGIYTLAAPAAVASVPSCIAPGAEGVDTTTTPGTTVVVVLPSSA